MGLERTKASISEEYAPPSIPPLASAHVIPWCHVTGTPTRSRSSAADSPPPSAQHYKLASRWRASATGRPTRYLPRSRTTPHISHNRTLSHISARWLTLALMPSAQCGGRAARVPGARGRAACGGPFEGAPPPRGPVGNALCPPLLTALGATWQVLALEEEVAGATSRAVEARREAEEVAKLAERKLEAERLNAKGAAEVRNLPTSPPLGCPSHAFSHMFSHAFSHMFSHAFSHMFSRLLSGGRGAQRGFDGGARGQVRGGGDAGRTGTTHPVATHSTGFGGLLSPCL